MAQVKADNRVSNISINHSDTRYFDHAVGIVESFHLYQCNRGEIFSEDRAVGRSQGLFIVPIGFQIRDINGEGCVLVWTAADCFDGRLKIAHYATELHYEIAFTDDLAVFIERRLAGNMDQVCRQ